MGVADALNIKTTFDLATSPCRFIFEDLSDYASLGISSADVLGNLVITGPTGPIHSNISWVTPDIDLAVSPIIDTILTPTDTDGKPFPGVYSVQYTVQVSGGVLPGEYSYTNTFEYTYQTPELKIAWVNNPYNAYLSATDTTEYAIASVSPLKTYVNTLILPPLYGFQNIVSNSFRIAVTAPYYLEGLYVNEIETSLSYAFPSYNVLDTLSGNSEFNVIDTTNLADVYCCIKSLSQKMMRAKGNPTLHQKYTDMFAQATGLWQLIEQAVTLGQYSDINKYVEQIYCVTECTPGCSCSGNLTPQIQPYSSQTSSPGETPSTDEFEIGDFKATSRSSVSALWRFAIGQVELITDYQEFYDIIGDQFNIGGEPGGYFRFPDTRSRVLMGAGQGVGLSNRVFATMIGTEFYDATHAHAVDILATLGGSGTPDSDLSLGLNGTIIVNDFDVIALGLYDIAIPNGTATGSADGPVALSGSATNIGGEITIPALDVTVNVAHTGVTDSAALSVDFSNANNHTDTISEAAPHDHDVTIPSTFQTAEAVGNSFADPGIYTTTGHTVSIALNLAHTGTQDLSHSHDYSFDITGSGATVSTPITASGLEGDASVSGVVSIPVSGTTTTPNITGILQSETSVSGVEGTCEISQSVTLPNYTVSVSGNVIGDTDSASIIVPTITPSLVVRYAVKVA